MDITEEELQLVEQLREKALDFVEKDEHKDEAFLIRWIRARDKDLNRAAESLMHSLQWRKEHDMDSLINLSIDPIFAEKYKRDLECHDKDGRPGWWNSFDSLLKTIFFYHLLISIQL